MSILAILADFASLAGLAVALYTLYKVNRLPGELQRHSRLRILAELIQKLEVTAVEKPKLTASVVREIRSVVHMVRTYDLPRRLRTRRTLRVVLESLENELDANKSTASVLIKLRLIHGEIDLG